MRQEVQWQLVDHWRRQYFLRLELQFRLFRSLKKNTISPLIYRQYMAYRLVLLPHNMKIIKQKNRCLRTGRVRGVLKKFQYSRFVVRVEGYSGILPGFTRASW